MNFQTFAAYRDHALAHNPALLDLSDTRFARLLAPVQPQGPFDTIPGRAYRCHLVEDWLAWWGLPESWKPRALASCGVRHSLTTLFTGWAGQGYTVALPQDIYPVYQTLADQAGVRTTAFTTVPALVTLPDEADVLLLADPVKPRGNGLDEQELHRVLAWLSEASHRRVVVDAVYAMGPRLPLTVQRLLATDRAIVVHSLSKGWVQAEVFGVALVPDQDVPCWTPVFRALPTLAPGDAGNPAVHEHRLKIAQWCLRPTFGAEMPSRLSRAWQVADRILDHELQRRGVMIPPVHRPSVPRYMRVLPIPVETLVQDHGVLALPLSTFGSTDLGQSVLSALRWVPETFRDA